MIDVAEGEDVIIQVSGILKPKLLQMFHKLMVYNGGFCWFESHES